MAPSDDRSNRVSERLGLGAMCARQLGRRADRFARSDAGSLKMMNWRRERRIARVGRMTRETMKCRCKSHCFILLTSFALLFCALQAMASGSPSHQRPKVDAREASGRPSLAPQSIALNPQVTSGATAASAHRDPATLGGEGRRRDTRSPAALLLAVSGSKSEPPSRPSVDWSKQRPYFGLDMQRNVSVELGKTAYLTCKVYELGDKTVSWLRPRENEILTAGRYTYIGDSRFASINDNGSHDWILEIKDVGLNDSTSYECQVSTDPKMSFTINLQVKAAKAKIKQGEQLYAQLGSNIELTCDISQRAPAYSQLLGASQPNGLQQTYWYYNGNLLNYARTNAMEKNFSIDWDSLTQTSRFKLFNVQLNDAGNYTCKPTSAESATIRLHVKRSNKGTLKDRTHHGNSNHLLNPKEAQRTRQHYALDSNGVNGSELVESGSCKQSIPNLIPITIMSFLINLLLTTSRRN